MSLGVPLNVNVLTAFGREVETQGTLLIVTALIVTAALLRLSPRAPELRSRMQFCMLLGGLHLLLLPAVAIASALEAGIARDLRLTSSICVALAGVGISGLLLFGLLFPKLRLEIPHILQDMVVATLGTVAVFGTASRAGVNLSGIVATGAVLTAVIGLALQDTLGNVVGGLSLQLDATIREGDWIRVQELTGKVVEIRWRSTSIETRNWETVILPNSLLTKTQVTVLGRRTGQDRKSRRWVYFNVDFRFAPSQVINLVTDVLRSRPIDNVAAAPAIDCILMELGESAARYAVRYWLTDLAVDDPTDSIVRTRVYFALTRAEIPLSMPAHAVFLTEDSPERRQYKREAELERRIAVLSRIDLFRDLSESERAELAGYLHRAPFVKGEVLTREGAEAHHLYMIYSGSASVSVREGNQEREVGQVAAGECFGEMSLLTGEKRSATVIALTDVECYRLDAEAFRRLLERRTDLAEKVAAQLAERRVEQTEVREELANRKTLVEMDQRDLLQRIREFFHL